MIAFTRRTTDWIIAAIGGAAILWVPAPLLVAGIPDSQSYDVAFPLRKQAWRIAGTLIHCGISQEEARDIALHRTPGATGWWTNTLLPRLSEEHQRMAAREIERYREMVRKSDDIAIDAYLSELAIWKMIQQEKHLSTTEIFDLWQAGIVNQTDERWNALLDGLPTEKQDRLRKMRQQRLMLSR